MSLVQNVKNTTFVSSVYRNFTSRRVIHCINREYPIAIPTSLFVIGQIFAWQATLETTVLVFLVALGAFGWSKRLALIAVLYFSLGAFSTSFISKQPDIRQSWEAQTLVGKVDSPLRHPRAGEIVFSLKVIGSLRKDTDSDFTFFPAKTKKRMLCKTPGLPWKNAYNARQGDAIAFRADVRLLAFEPDITAYSSRLLRRGYVATCKIRYAAILDKSKPGVRANLLKKIGSQLGPGDAAAVMLAMLFGKRDLMSNQTNWAFRALGLSHLLVVSGFHVGVFYVFFKTILRLMCTALVMRIRCLPFVPIIEWSSILSSTVYVWLTGWGESSIRALIALACIVIHQLTGRGKPGIFTGVWFALLLFSIVWPTCIAEPGVQFTLAALVAIAVSQTERNKSLLSLYIYTSVATGFICLLWFDYFPVFSFLFNFLLAPIIVLLVCKLGFLFSALYLINVDHAGWGLYWLKSLVQIMISVLKNIADQPYLTLAVEGYAKELLAGLMGLVILWKLYQSYGTFLKQYNVFHYRSS